MIPLFGKVITTICFWLSQFTLIMHRNTTEGFLGRVVGRVKTVESNFLCGQQLRCFHD